MKARAWLGGLAVLLAAAGAAAYVFRGEIATRLVERAAQTAMAENLREGLPDGLHAAFCGTGSPLPDRTRAGPCLAIIAGQHTFVFDAGDGASETLSLMGIQQNEIETLFLTHLHSDHIDGIDTVALQHWATGPSTEQLRVVGTDRDSTCCRRTERRLCHRSRVSRRPPWPRRHAAERRGHARD